MARAIDKQTMLDLIVEAKRTDPETGGFAEWLAEYLAEHLPTLTPVNEAPPCYQPDGDGCSYQCYDGDDEPIDKCKECPLCYSDKQRHHAPPNEPLTQADLDIMHFDRVWIDYGVSDDGEREGEDGVVLYGKLYSIDTLDGSAFEDLLFDATGHGDMVDSKTMSAKGTGTIRFHKVNSRMAIKMSDNLKNGKDTRVKLISNLDDPDAYGAERVVIYDASFDDLTLADWEAAAKGQIECPFTFTRWDYLDLIQPR